MSIADTALFLKRYFAGDPRARVVYVTEGALKADIAHALTGRTFVAAIGANNSNLIKGL